MRTAAAFDGRSATLNIADSEGPRGPRKTLNSRQRLSSTGHNKRSWSGRLRVAAHGKRTRDEEVVGSMLWRLLIVLRAWAERQM
ncbi:MAG: hypothetical protein QOF10_344 [Kribbellaceae bacterium]|jgi:hypothetical protein|nr:hypothetical protein [Kribbellaceae bacterium]